MSILEQIKKDTQDILTDVNGWSTSITLTSPDGFTITVMGLHTKHHLAVDTDGQPVNSKNAHISLSEPSLIAKDYPVRKGGEVSLTGHRVAVADSTGIPCQYIISENYPDETIGLIVCLLRDFE